MSASPSPRIGLYGSDEASAPRFRASNVWGTGYRAMVSAAGGTPVPLRRMPGCSWDELLDRVDGVVFAGGAASPAALGADEERLCEWCRELALPLLAVDRGLHALNLTFGGTLHHDLPRDLPLALQHKGVPEPGDRHAATVHGGTRLAGLYGAGEVVVNSEHRRAVCRVAQGFIVGATSLDGVVEAIEAEDDRWFALGVQWHPASASASGLDLQLFRGLVDACGQAGSRQGHGGQLVAA
jgi:putative glutamine amidotransferase